MQQVAQGEEWPQEANLGKRVNANGGNHGLAFTAPSNNGDEDQVFSVRVSQFIIINGGFRLKRDRHKIDNTPRSYN